MASEHAEFTAPEDRNAKIWRYMDFTKYVEMLEASGLFFPRARELLRQDPFEGSFPKPTVAAARRSYQGFAGEDIGDTLYKLNSDFIRESLDDTLISCWHMSSHESAAMWKLYASSHQAVAIQSTFQRLWDVLDNQTYVGVVKYIDFNLDGISRHNGFIPFLHKRRSFEHEREVRAMRLDTADKENPGRMITINLPALVEAVYVAPQSEDWYYDLVASVTTRYNYAFPVRRSDLDSPPIW